jgi:hypothetical protein
MSIYEVGASVPPVCPSCGTDTNLARRCGACGRVFIPDEVNPEPAQKNKSRYLRIGGIAVAVAAAGFALWHAASPALHSSSLVVPSAQSQPVPQPAPIDVPATDQPPRKSVSAAHGTTKQQSHNRKKARKRTKKR